MTDFATSGHPRPRRARATIAISALIILTAAEPNARPAPVREESDATWLGPEVVVSADRRDVYLMDDPSGVVALDARTGRRRWRAAAAQKPLLADDRFVLALGAPHTGALELLLLDRGTGRVRRALPPVSIAGWASSSMVHALGSSFSATAERRADAAVVHWDAGTYYAGGARLLHPPPGKTATGDVYVLLPSGEVLRTEIDSAVDISRPMEPRTPAGTSTPPPEVLSSDTIGDTVVMTVHRLASDGTALGQRATRATRGRIYVQSSGDGRTFAIVRTRLSSQPRVTYRGTIYSASSGEELGKIASPGPFGPFLVLDRATLVGLAWQHRCSSRGTGCVSVQVLRGVSLPGGRVHYAHPIRDLQYRGPYPP